MNAWSHLPNATHIDWVIKSLKSHPEVWSTARIAAWEAARIAAWDATWEAPRIAAYGAVWSVARGAARSAAWEAAYGAVWSVARGAARNSALDTILALIAYDDAAKYLDMTTDQLKMWAILSEEPAAVLLIPAAIVCEKINELEFA